MFPRQSETHYEHLNNSRQTRVCLFVVNGVILAHGVKRECADVDVRFSFCRGGDPFEWDVSFEVSTSQRSRDSCREIRRPPLGLPFAMALTACSMASRRVPKLACSPSMRASRAATSFRL